MRIFDETYSYLLEKALDGAFLRQEAINNNLANVDTPGYKRTEVSFQNELRRISNNDKADELAMRVSDPRHLTGQAGLTDFTPQVKVIKDYSEQNNGNNVDIDVEMAEQAKNALYYDAVSTSLNFRFRSLETVITGGKR